MHQNTISILIPAYNESESLPTLIAEIVDVVKQIKIDFEIIIINDGSLDNTDEVVGDLLKQTANLKYVQLRCNVGKASALHAGIVHSSNEWIITLDADLQDDPREILQLIKKLEQGYDLVVGWKQHREHNDPLSKTLPSKLFNYFTNQVAHTQIHDHNCGLKIMNREVALSLPLYGDLHRYIPALAAMDGFKMTEIPVHHRARRFGKSKYGIKRIIHGLFDITTVIVLAKFSAKPMHFFGYAGLIIFSIGFIIGLFLTYEKIVLQMKIGDRPLLNLAMLCMILGVQFGMTGIIGELLNFYKNDPARYYKIKQIKKSTYEVDQ